MDLVRLGLERGRTAEHALDVMTGLLEQHGQGGLADAANDEAYFSSFLIADPRSAWILETSASTWVAEPATDGAAISNRLSVRTGWTRASAGVAPGTDFESYRDPGSWAALADVRLACTLPAVAGEGRVDRPADLAALLRHHGERPWGRPGDDSGDISPLPPEEWGANAEGFSVCMHLRGYQATAASMICDLPADDDEPMRAWVAPGSPCVSVFVPVFPPADVPTELADAATWSRVLALRERVEANPDALADVRAVLGPIEAELWTEADAVAGNPFDQATFATSCWSRVDEGLRRLGA
jgi:secernin